MRISVSDLSAVSLSISRRSLFATVDCAFDWRRRNVLWWLRAFLPALARPGLVGCSATLAILPPLSVWTSCTARLQCLKSIGVSIKSDEILELIIVKQLGTFRLLFWLTRIKAWTHILGIIEELYLHSLDLLAWVEGQLLEALRKPVV